MLLFIIITILAGAQAAIGIEMGNRPPGNDSDRRFWRIVFLIIFIATGVVGFFQYEENDRQQTDFTNRLGIVQLQLTNSVNELRVVQIELTNSMIENVDLRREMKEQFDRLTDDFSTNSSIAVAARIAILTNQLDEAIAEGNELQKSHELFDVSPVGIDAVRTQRESDLAIQENQAKQRKLQADLDAIHAQQSAAEQVVEAAEQQRQAEKDLFEEERTFSAPALPVFDYTIRKLYEALDGVSKGSGWAVSSDFAGQSPTIYASALARSGIILNGTNYIAIGTSPAWHFTISTSVAVPPQPNRSLYENTFGVLTIQVTTTNGDSKLTVSSQYRTRFASRYSYLDFQQNKIQGDYWFNNVQISLDIPNGLNMDEGCAFNCYTNNIDKAITRLVGAQDQQFKIPTL